MVPLVRFSTMTTISVVDDIAGKEKEHGTVNTPDGHPELIPA
jgi:hypothetical protein